MHIAPRAISVRRRLPATLLSVLVALVAGGCSDDDGTNGATPTRGGAGELQHVDGTIAIDGGKLTVQPSGGGEPMTLGAGPEVAAAEAQAIAASGEKARVYYREGEDPLAVRVQKMTISDAAKRTTGQVSEVTETTLTLEPESGDKPLRLTIRPENAASFDVEHLEEHRSAGEPITVYHENAHGTDYALAYEDA